MVMLTIALFRFFVEDKHDLTGGALVADKDCCFKGSAP